MRRAAALRPLSDDHHGALVLSRRCRRAAEEGGVETLREARDAVLEAWVGELAPHFAIEEEALLPALRELGASGFADAIRDDHARLRALRARIAEITPSARPAARGLLAETLAEFAERLERHVRYEERQVFAAVQDRLNASQQEALAQAVAAHPRAPAGPPEPG